MSMCGYKYTSTSAWEAKGIRSPEAGTTGDCELPDKCREDN